jgi:hypothetical protein
MTAMSCYVVTSRMYSYTAVQKNRVHFKNQAIKFPGILCFVNGDFIIISLNPPPPGNFAGVHTLLRIILSSNSAVLINIITGVSPPHFDFVLFYYVLWQSYGISLRYDMSIIIYLFEFQLPMCSLSPKFLNF